MDNYLEQRKKLLLLEKRRHNLNPIVTPQEITLLKSQIPIQKIIGFVQMQDVKIDISHKVLIPRYETEEVILEAYKYIKKDSQVLDLCCGSGFIGIAIAKNKKCFVTMSDIDSEAIKQSQINAQINNVKVNIIQSNLFENIHQKFDVIISNPPYIDIDDQTKLSSSVLDFEPHHALFASNNGLYFYQQILLHVEHYLNRGGYLIFEIAPEHLPFFEKYNDFQIIKDINNKARIAIKQF